VNDPDFLDRNLARLLSAEPAPAMPGPAVAEKARLAIKSGFVIRRRRAVVRFISTAAAAAVLGIVAGQVTRRPQPVAEGELHLEAGASVSLADGVLARAQEPSDLSVVRTRGHAVASLTSGDVIFDVTPGLGGLSVKTACGTVRVTGTLFEVRSAPMQRGEAIRLSVVCVAVFAGTVVFVRNGSEGQPLHAEETIIALPNGSTERLTLAEVSARMQQLAGAETQNGVLARNVATRDQEIRSLKEQLAAATRQPAPVETPPAPRHGLDAIEWDRAGAALLKSTKAMKGNDKPDAEAMGEIGKLLQALGSLKDELGGGSPNELLANPDVQSRLVGAIAKTLSPSISDDDRTLLQDEIRKAAETSRQTRPKDAAPLTRIDFDLAATDNVRSILARHVGDELAQTTDGLTIGAVGDLTYGRTYVAAPDRTAMVAAIMSYWTEAVHMDDSQLAPARQIAESWADAFMAVRDRAIREFGVETARAALTKPPEQGLADPLAATRSDPAFSARHKSIVGWVREVQAKYENAFYLSLRSEQKTVYGGTDPELLMFSAEP